MPVGKPTDDGEIVLGSRHGVHKGGLGPVGPWDCPACGIKNEGRRPEAGCAHCGSGDPLKSTGGQQGRAGIPTTDETSLKRSSRTPAVPLERAGAPASLAAPSATRIYRLIEYIVSDPGAVQDVLRRSLVGTLQMPWGQLTGAIVDSVDGRQEDLLRMARMQPGVWLAQEPRVPGGAPALVRTAPPLVPHSNTGGLPPRDPLLDEAVEHFNRLRKDPPVEMPETGPEFDQRELDLAMALFKLGETMPAGGYAFIHTLSLALSNVATELDGNMEPEKFVPSRECLRLANALLSLIPDQWLNPADPPEETA